MNVGLPGRIFIMENELHKMTELWFNNPARHTRVCLAFLTDEINFAYQTVSYSIFESAT